MSPAFESINDVPLCEKFLATLKLCKYPKWKCYLKRVNSSHLVLTFVPASFADLKLLMLNQSTMDEKQNNGKSVKFFAVPTASNTDEDKQSQSEGNHLFEASMERLENLSIPESHSVPEMGDQEQQVADLMGSRPPLSAVLPFRERSYSLDAEQRKRSLLDFR
jgi:hypothetical protein